MDNWYKKIPTNSFYYRLRKWADENIKDEDFADLFPSSTGRPSLPPTISFLAVFIQLHNEYSDREMQEAALFDDRVKFALGLSRSPEYEVSKSTLSRHRAMFIENNIMRSFLKNTLYSAADHGLFEDATSDIVDSFMIHGATSKRDTYTLIKMAMKRTLRLAEQEGLLKEELTALLQYKDYEAKGKPKINWNDESEKNQLLTNLVEDARRINEYIHQYPTASNELIDAADLLLLVAEQDIEEKDGQIVIAHGTCKDRTISITDSEIRHGHKTTSKKHDGYKGNVLVGGTEHDIITAVEVTPANAADSEALPGLLEQREENVGKQTESLLGDTAYGAANTRVSMEKVEINLIAKVPPASNKNGMYSKDAFNIELEARTITCPAGNLINMNRDNGSFTFPKKTCADCELRPQCTSGKNGRTIVVHKEERVLQKAREEQETTEFKEKYRLRPRVERIISNITANGARKARYYGKEKTLFQLMVHAVIHNVVTIFKHIEGNPLHQEESVLAPV
jgi:hypothetical protein